MTTNNLGLATVILVTDFDLFVLEKKFGTVLYLIMVMEIPFILVYVVTNS